METLIRWQVVAMFALARAGEAALGTLAGRARSGQGMAEYAVIASVVVTIVIVGLTVLANALSDYFSSVGAWFSSRKPT
jgi:Flp pilus assembly pilin Flp